MASRPSTRVTFRLKENKDDSISSDRKSQGTSVVCNKDEGWRKPGRIYRQQLIQKDEESGNTFALNKDCKIERYYLVAEKVFDQFLNHAIDDDEDIIDAYLVGTRLVKFLGDILPAHPSYHTESKLKQRAQQQLVEILQYLEPIEKLIDEKEHQRYIQRVLDQGKYKNNGNRSVSSAAEQNSTLSSMEYSNSTSQLATSMTADERQEETLNHANSLLRQRDNKENEQDPATLGIDLRHQASSWSVRSDHDSNESPLHAYNLIDSGEWPAFAAQKLPANERDTTKMSRPQRRTKKVRSGDSADASAEWDAAWQESMLKDIDHESNASGEEWDKLDDLSVSSSNFGQASNQTPTAKFKITIVPPQTIERKSRKKLPVVVESSVHELAETSGSSSEPRSGRIDRSGTSSRFEEEEKDKNKPPRPPRISVKSKPLKESDFPQGFDTWDVPRIQNIWPASGADVQRRQEPPAHRYSSPLSNKDPVQGFDPFSCAVVEEKPRPLHGKIERRIEQARSMKRSSRPRATQPIDTDTLDTWKPPVPFPSSTELSKSSSSYRTPPLKKSFNSESPTSIYEFSGWRDAPASPERLPYSIRYRDPSVTRLDDEESYSSGALVKQRRLAPFRNCVRCLLD